MGQTFSVRCPCGFEETSLRTGAGMLGIAYEPVVCRKCRRAFALEADRLPSTCAKCGSALEILQWDMPGKLARCPVCERETMQVFFTALWD